MTVLLISSDAIDTEMAGPGIRYWEFARHLSQNHEVILLTPNPSSLTYPGVRILQHTKASLKSSLTQADVVVTQGYIYALPPLMLSGKPLVIDLYDPLPIELLEHHSHLSLPAAQLSQSYCIERTNMLLRRGDFFLYSHERQRDYWLGMLTAVGRIQHTTYRQDPTYNTLLGCVPYGISDDEPVLTNSVLRHGGSRFDEDDTIILWGGGLWKWFDPCSLIRAVAAISTTRQDIKLLFLGVKRAESDTTGINIAYSTEEAIAVSRELGVYERSVFFHDRWIPYAERQNYLLDADIGVSTHFDSLETRLSFRTRILDYLWAGLPVLSTSGDYLSEFVERHQLGIVVPPADVEQIKHAILRLATDQVFSEQCRKNIQRIRSQFTWKHSMKPLEKFCAAPYRTSAWSRTTTCARMGKFYLHTMKLLIQHRGYQKILAKLKKHLL